jgi:hypothetical protein
VANQPAIVAGNRMIDEAKIGGITPAMLSLSGRCELWPAVDLVADLALGVVDQDLALPALDEHHERRSRRRPARG